GCPAAKCVSLREYGEPRRRGDPPTGRIREPHRGHTVENSRQWALGPNHPIVNRFLGSLTKFDAHEWIAVLQAHSSPSGRLVAEVEAAATNAGRGSAVANARRVSKQFVAYNHWAGQRWQDRVVSILAEAGSRLNAV